MAAFVDARPKGQFMRPEAGKNLPAGDGRTAPPVKPGSYIDNIDEIAKGARQAMA